MSETKKKIDKILDVANFAHTHLDVAHSPLQTKKHVKP